jgi:hypothetical protein
MIVLPRSVGTFLTSRVDTSRNDSVMSRIEVISEALISCVPRISLRVKVILISSHRRC